MPLHLTNVRQEKYTCTRSAQPSSFRTNGRFRLWVRRKALRRCKRPKKKSCICKTTSEALKEKIADAPDEAVEASVQATGPTGIPAKKRKRSSAPASADGRRTHLKKA